MIRIQPLLLLLLLGTQQLFAQDAVKKNLDDLTIVIPGAGSEPGIGENDGVPGGTDFRLPPAFRFVDRPGKAFDPDIKKLYGNANTFYADVNIEIIRDSIKIGSPTLIILPIGLVMLNVAPSRVQNGMLMGRVRINVPPIGIGPGGLRDTITAYIGLVCLNKGLSFPWEENVNSSDDVKEYPIGLGMYKPSKVTSHKGLLMLAQLLDQYPKLQLTRHYNPQLQYQDGYVQPEWNRIYDLIQKMVWKVTEGPGITKGELEKFKTVLAPYK